MIIKHLSGETPLLIFAAQIHNFGMTDKLCCHLGQLDNLTCPKLLEECKSAWRMGEN